MGAVILILMVMVTPIAYIYGGFIGGRIGYALAALNPVSIFLVAYSPELRGAGNWDEACIWFAVFLSGVSVIGALSKASLPKR